MSPTLDGNKEHLTLKTGAAVGPAAQEQLAAVEGAVLRLELQQGHIEGDAARSGRRRQLDSLSGEQGSVAPLRVVGHLHGGSAPLPVQNHAFHSQAFAIWGETRKHSGVSGAGLDQVQVHGARSISREKRELNGCNIGDVVT